MLADSAASSSLSATSGRLSLIGIGMGSAEDITLRGLTLAKASDVVFLEHYTAILIDDADTTKLEKLIGKPVVLADRDAVESGEVLVPCEKEQKRVSLLVVGDPLSATTHCDLIERCSQKHIQVDVVGNASIITAVGCVGLQLYRYGQALSMCFWTEGWQPASYYDRLAANRALGTHTLLLLDIKVKEISDENLARGRKIYEPPRYMSASVAARQLLEIEQRRKLGVALPHHVVVAVARLGSPSALVLVGKLEDFARCTDGILGAPLHSMVFPGDIHDCEADYVLLHKQLVVGPASPSPSSSSEADDEAKKKMNKKTKAGSDSDSDEEDQQQQQPSVNLVVLDPAKPDGASAKQIITKDDLDKSKLSPEVKKAILGALADGTIFA